MQKTDRMSRMPGKRGASATPYGLVVGLIAVIALGAVTTIGANIDGLFTETADTLKNVTENSNNALPDPSQPAVTVGNLSFDDLSNQATSSQVVSAIIDPAATGQVSIAVSGDGSPEVRVCDDAACNSVAQGYATSASLDAGQYVQLRATTSGSTGTGHVIAVTAGSASTTWTITTGSGDCFGASSCVFHTSIGYSGDLGGLSGADSICTNDPNNPGGQAYAVLATNGYNHQRGMSLKLPIRRASDNTVVATSESQFFCHHSGCGDWAAGLASTTGSRVWTGVVYLYNVGNPWNGSPAGANCNGWTNSTGSYTGNMGNRSSNTAVSKPSVWMEGNYPPSCATQYVITCISNVQTPPP